MAVITFAGKIKDTKDKNIVRGMTLKSLKVNCRYFLSLADRNCLTSFITIFENKKEYPKFEWVEIFKTEYKTRRRKKLKPTIKYLTTS